MTFTVTPWNGQPIGAPGIYSGVPMSVYHSADICVGPAASSSHLRTIFNDSALAYWIYSPLNPRRLEQPDKKAWIEGRGAHHLVLGEAAFDKHFIVQPETYPDAKTGEPKAWSGNATHCKTWKARAAEAKLTVLTPAQIEMIKGMAGVQPWQEGLEDSGLKNTAVVRAGALSGLIEHTIIAKDEETGIWIKSRPDVIPVDSLEFVDFKTIADPSDDSVRRTLEDHRYDMQADLANQCLKGAVGRAFESFGFVFAGKSPPHATNAIEVDPVDLAEAEADNRAALRTLARCIDTGRWPGPAGTRGDAATISRSEWSRKNAVGRRNFLQLELDAAA